MGIEAFIAILLLLGSLFVSIRIRRKTPEDTRHKGLKSMSTTEFWVGVFLFPTILCLLILIRAYYPTFDTDVGTIFSLTFDTIFHADFATIFFETVWWIACLLIAVGFYYVFLVVVLGLTLDYEKDDGESAVVFIFLYIRILLFIVPAACILFLLWLFNLAPEAFSFLGSPSLNETSGFMDYDILYIVGEILKWLSIFAFVGGLIWGILAGISVLWRMMVNYKK